MHIERIKEAVRWLKQVHAEARPFDYTNWGSTEHPCGTVACAGGWLTLNPALQAQGLDHTTSLDYRATESNLIPTYAGKTDIIALAEFFEITVQEALNIFVRGTHQLYATKCIDELTAYDIVELLEALLPLEAEPVEHCDVETPQMAPA